MITDQLFVFYEWGLFFIFGRSELWLKKGIYQAG